MSSQRSLPLTGVAQALGGYIFWGLFPLYFVPLAGVLSSEVLAHRIIGALVLLALLFGVQGRFGELRGALRSALGSARRMGFYLLTSGLISANWLIYIWAIQNAHVLDASMGYFINPLVSVLLAMVFLGERLRRFQWLAVLLVAIGVGFMVIGYGAIPWVALSLAFSFGTYGLLRKKARLPAMSALWVETLILSPLALAWLLWLYNHGSLSIGHLGWKIDAWLLLAGAVTVLPLYLFLSSMRHLNLTTIGILQYLAPSLQFLIGLWLGERFGEERWVTFGFIWMALVVFTWDALRHARQVRVSRRKIDS